MTQSSPALFSPLQLGSIPTKNRVFMAPLTRCRADAQTLAATELHATYYAQRASAGLIVSEATQIHATGQGYPNTPGIFSAAQEAGWKLTTDAVHAKGGNIVAQLWHVGAISHPDFQPNGALPVSSSDYNPGGTIYTQHGKKERVAARPLSTQEVHEMIAAYKHAAEVAKRAGFDGVEIHSANGYLLEQFIRDSINKRSDEFGGSIENRIRFTLAAVDAAISVFGAGRVGIRLSPVSAANAAMRDSDTQASYGALVEALAQRRIAFVHFIEGNTGGARDLTGFDFAWAKKVLTAAGVAYIANNKYDRAMAIEAVESGAADAVAFGVPFISNPDLPERLKLDAPLTPANPKTFYSPGPEGYTDYATMHS
ncbi:MAG: alkene reductase [Burkholderiales bacterium]|nr:MAG: alkene reductase [Betaproteobacteria bacterium]TAG83774.1 MAG: alkene reductase [Burkholderiales bacterium]